TNTMNTPIEAIEAYLPIEFKAYRLRPDSGGAGRFRGGCGIERVWTLVGESATLSIMAERTKNRPWGLEGGKPGAPGEFTLVKASGERITLPPKCTINMERGDTLIIRTPGGGGFGDPSERETWRVEEDMLDGLVSPEAARRDYGYTPKEYKQRR
ncbi:MAG TPA: 5-oxoprolinase, partial [Candidatus Bathyarchaeota archaeon]|nr:5-oxoprolinase [Candidatus Bathyarchaeota archaeon]